MGSHPQVVADSGVFEREGSESADKRGLTGLSDGTMLEGDVELRLAGRALQFASSRLWPNSELPLTAGTVDLNFENLRNEGELARAGAASQLGWSLFGTRYYDCVAVRTGQGLVGEIVNGGLVADAADCTADLALLLTQSLGQHVAAVSAFC